MNQVLEGGVKGTGGSYARGDDSLLLSSRSPLTGLVTIAQKHDSLSESKLKREVSSFFLSKGTGRCLLSSCFSSKVLLALAPGLWPS